MTRIEAISILGNPDPGKESVFKAYRRKAKEYHPDLGGNLELMVLVNLAFEVLEAIDFQWPTQDGEQARNSTPLTETLSNLWNEIKHYRGIQGEVIGTWLWVSGDTYPIREYLKGLGFRFSHLKRAWYFHEGAYWKHSKNNFDMNDLRAMWGSEDLESEEAEAIAH